MQRREVRGQKSGASQSSWPSVYPGVDDHHSIFHMPSPGFESRQSRSERDQSQTCSAKGGIEYIFPPISSRGGQAMVELAVALIVIMVLVAGLIQIGRLTSAHTQTMIDARAAAGEDAMSTNYNPAADSRYIFSWLTGPDTNRYTHDDIPSSATNAIEGNLEMVALASPAELAAQAPGNAFSTVGASANMVDEFFLVKGHASESCPTMGVIRTLVDNQDSITVESDAWLVWTENIY